MVLTHLEGKHFSHDDHRHWSKSSPVRQDTQADCHHGQPRDALGADQEPRSQGRHADGDDQGTAG